MLYNFSFQYCFGSIRSQTIDLFRTHQIPLVDLVVLFVVLIFLGIGGGVSRFKPSFHYGFVGLETPSIPRSCQQSQKNATRTRSMRQQRERSTKKTRTERVNAAADKHQECCVFFCVACTWSKFFFWGGGKIIHRCVVLKVI